MSATLDLKKWVVLTAIFFSFSANAKLSIESEIAIEADEFAENEFVAFLPHPPARGSAEEREDYRILHEYQDRRTEAECNAAAAQSKFSFDEAFGPAAKILTQKEMKKVKALAAMVMAKTSIAALYFKIKFHRKRPYQVDETLDPCISKPKGGMAYPSGHAANGIALAEVLAERFPQKKDLILKQGYQIGLNRILGGVHHPSDVEAGRMLGRHIAEYFTRRITASIK